MFHSKKKIWNTNLKEYNKKYNEPFGESKRTNEEDDVILASNLYLSLDSEKTKLNSNRLIVGGGGSGKTWSFFKPNILQMNSNYIINDTKLEIYQEVKDILKNAGYQIKVFSVEQTPYSTEEQCYYNPFHYAKTEQDIKQIVECIMQNGSNSYKKKDLYFENAISSLLLSVIYYMIEKYPKEKHNFQTIMSILPTLKIEITAPKSQYDKMINELEIANPKSLAVKYYKKCRLGMLDNTFQTVAIETCLYMEMFSLELIQELTNKDTIALNEICNQKQVIFINYPICDSTFNPLFALLCMQLMNITKENNETKIQFMLDNFCRIKIPNLTEILTTSPKNISFNIGIQQIDSLTQLYEIDIYELNQKFDVLIFAGIYSKITRMYVSSNILHEDYCGTILDEMNGNEWIVCIKNEKPFKMEKYNLKKHPKYI